MKPKRSKFAKLSQLSKLFSFSTLKTGATAMKWMAMLPFNLKAGSEENLSLNCTPL